MRLVMRRPLPIAAFVLLVACEKSAPTPDPAPSKEPAATIVPPPAAPPSSTAPPTASAAPPASAASAATVALGTSADAGKPKARGGTPEPVSKRVDSKNFALELTSPGCKAASECVLTIKLVAAGDYHVNKEYPYKFIAGAAPGIEFLGRGEANTFTRAAGDFVEQGAKTGTMTVRFKAASPGDARVAGTYRFSVCSADQCQIEQEKLDLDVPVM